jgi:hypothetical protein
MKIRSFSTLALVATASLLSACAGMGGNPAPFSQASLPAAVQVPTGHTVSLETVARGEITYECRAKTNQAGAFEWVFVGPQATLMDRQGRTIGRYFGPPATWAAGDGSAITATQLAVAPAGPGAIPLQLTRTNPATGSGLMSGHTHIQRVATQGGTAPASPCDAQTAGQRQVVRYQADYIFWKAA